MTEAATGGVLRNFAKFPGKHLCQSLLFNKTNYFWDRYFPVNFAKFLRISYLQNTSGRLLLKWNKTKCLPSLTAFSSLSDINVTLKIGITLTWSFTLRYAIATIPLWCWKKIPYNDSLQFQYMIGLYRDVNPTKKRCHHNIGCPLGSLKKPGHKRVVLHVHYK